MSSSKLRTVFRPLSTQVAMAEEELLERGKSFAVSNVAATMINRRIQSEQLHQLTPNSVEGVILDWSGTTIDRYAMAPTFAFVEVFKKFGVKITPAEAREPMGLRKDAHIAEILKMPSVRKKWKEVYGRAPDELNKKDIFEKFLPLQIKCLKNYTELLPGVAKTSQDLQKIGILIGVTTGFSKEMVDILLCHAKEQGFTPDAAVGGDEVLNGTRPYPNMLFKNMDLLGIANPKSVIKVDDTVSGIGEGLNAGCWSVGFSKWSSYVGVDSFEHEAQLSFDELEEKRMVSREKLLNSGAHYVVDDINSLPNVILDVNRRLINGESPSSDYTNLKASALLPFKKAKAAQKSVSEDARSLTGYPTWTF